VNEAVEPEAFLGQVLCGKWHLDALLGVGGMAWVFAATHRNRCRVAIKLLSPDARADEEVERRFRREGYVANSVGHAAVARVLDDDVHDGIPFLVLELLEGRTFADLRRDRGGTLDARTVLHLADVVLDVLAAAHERAIVHRDLKPSNVLLTTCGEVKVLDFGIARMRLSDDESTASDERVIGSLAFMAPEQARGDWHPIDGRTDLWALGATLFQLLSGRHVHESSALDDRLRKAAHGRARTLREVVPDAPGAVAALVDRALAYEPADRFPDARTMQAAVRSAFASVTGAAIAPGPGPSEAGDEHTRAGPAPMSRPPDHQPPVLLMSRGEACEQLAPLGIQGAELYFLDTIPLLEMIWADGQVQPGELRLLETFVEAHVRNLNELAQREVVTVADGRRFTDRFLHERPDPALLALLRKLFVDVRLRGVPDTVRDVRRQAVLDFCLDLGAACVAEYPHGDHQRFCEREKRLFDDIFRSLR
jgi:eukaryotic-like serine/threonine-protein kinase